MGATTLITGGAGYIGMLVAEASERSRFGRSGVYDVTVRRENGDVVAEFRGRSRSRDERILTD